MELLFDGDERAPSCLILAHGAGAPMDSPFMDTVAAGIAGDDLRVARFEFPYMQRRRQTGRRGGPDRPAVLLDRWRGAVEAVRGAGPRVFVGGKSMGGRLASMIADEMQVDGLICMGYPFHPPGKPEKTRTAHLETLVTPALILQGTRDPFGRPDEVSAYALSAAIRVHWIEDGDHSFKPRVRSGRTEAQNLDEAIAECRRFILRGAGG